MMHEPGREEALAAVNQTTAEMEAEKAEGYRRNGFNQYRSDRISMVWVCLERVCV